MRVSEKFMRVWGFIIINWIIKLSLLRESIINIIYDLILVIINRLIKYIYFLLYIKESKIEEFTY